MPERIALHQIVVGRKDERHVVMPGETFDFSADDLSQLEGLDPPAVMMPPVVRQASPPDPGPVPTGGDGPRTSRRAPDSPAGGDDEL